jgi:VWFA-related protein
MRNGRGVLVCTFLALVTAAARGNGPAQEPSVPVFRSGSDFVRVDMFATRDGDLVTDLRPEDVEVFEDGVRQEIVTFEHVDLASQAAVPGAGDDDAALLDLRSRIFIVFIDVHTTQLRGDNELRLSLVRTLDRLLASDDLVGLMTPDMVVGDVALGERDAVISNLANDVRWLETEGRKLDLTEFAWENCYPSQRGPSTRLTDMKARRNARRTVDALQDLAYSLRDMREERKAVLLVTGGWPFAEELPPGGTRDSAGETPACRHDRLELGRMNFGSMLRDLTRAANRSNVSFYPVSTRLPLEPSREMPAQTRVRLQQRDKRARDTVRDQLRQLAEATDGFADYERDFEGVGRRIIDDTSSYYLIGYQSSNPDDENKYREISVKVNQPGVQVRARAGYGGETPRLINAAAVEPRGPRVDARVLESLASVERFDGLAPFWGRLSEWESTGSDAGAAFWFVGEVAPHRRSERGWTKGSIADITVLDGDREEVLTRTFELEPDAGTFGLRVPLAGRLPPGDYSVRVRVRPVEGDELAVQEVTRVSLAPGDSGPGEAVISRRNAAGQSDYRQTADPRFRRTERLRLELPTESSETITVRVLDRLGQPLPLQLPYEVRPDESAQFRWIVIDTSLAGLAPAFYTIEVAQGSVSRLTTFQLVP